MSNHLQQQQTWNWSDPEYHQTMKFIMVQDHESMDQNLVHKLLSSRLLVLFRSLWIFIFLIPVTLNTTHKKSTGCIKSQSKEDSPMSSLLCDQIHDCSILYTNFSYEAFRVVKTHLSANRVVFYTDNKSSSCSLIHHCLIQSLSQSLIHHWAKEMPSCHTRNIFRPTYSSQ